MYVCGCVCPTLLLLARYVRCDHCLSVSQSPLSLSLVPFPFLDGTGFGGGRVLAHDAVTAHMLAFDMCVYYMSTHRASPSLAQMPLHQPNEYVGVSVPLPLFSHSFFLSLWPGTVTNLVYLEPIHLAGRQAGKGVRLPSYTQC